MLLFASALAQEAEPPGPAQESQIWIPFEHHELDNGLDVILSEDHSVPFVWVNIWYSVGAKDEEEGRTGFAHLFEHLMFQGSEHHADEYFLPLQAVGARINGTTNFDRTNYYEGLPSQYLPLALWLESDRMGFLLPAVTQEALKNQQDVVRNERRQSYENRPYGKVWMWLFENLYPEGHPYHVPTIGRHEDIEAATLEDVHSFFETWYVPNNATLSIVGDFDPVEVLSQVETYFGPIPRGAQPNPILESTARLESEKVVHEIEPKGTEDKVWIAWITPALYAPGDADLDILSDLLSKGKNSRLYSKLVHELQIARSVEAYQYSARLHGQYIIEATAAAGHGTDELVEEIDRVLDTLRAEGPTTEEVDRAKLGWEVDFYQGLQTISAKANILSSYNTVTGNPGFITEDLARYRAVTVESTHRAMEQWLPADRRVVLHVGPPTEKEE
jgi:predicted Zn-dependent peptidase